MRVIGGLVALPAVAASGVFAFALVGSAAPNPAPRPASNIQATTLDVSTDGRMLYLNTCATCHGMDGSGGIGPPLVGVGPAAFDFFLRTGRMPLSAPGQPSFRQGTVLSEAQIEALVAYGTSLGTGGPAIPQLATDANLPDGYQLFINNCAQCHGATGSGGSIGQGVFAPSLRGRPPQIVAEAVLVGPGAMPQFNWDAQQLTDVAAYVEQLSSGPSPGGLALGGYGPVAEGLVAVVIGLGLIVLVVRWIARRESATALEEPPAEGES